MEEYGVAAVLELYATHVKDLSFVCFAKGPMYTRLKELDAHVEYVRGPRFVSALPSSFHTTRIFIGLVFSARRTASDLVDVLRRSNIQLLHINWMPHYFISLRIKRSGVRTVWQIHNNVNRRRLCGLGVLVYFYLARRGADMLLPVSEFTANQWKKSGVPSKIVRTAARPSSISDRPLSAQSNSLRCIVAGRLLPDKGHHVAIAAIAEARERGVKATLDVFGGPLHENPYAETLTAKIAELKLERVVRLRGQVHDLRAIHTHYDLALQCRIDPEPCSVWVCEAMLDGLLVLASATGGTPELIAHGVTGFLYPAGNAESLAHLITCIFSNRNVAEEIRIAGYRVATTRFTPTRMIDETLEAYATVLGK
jgi:glycosyltransferase involved in cell wall biosynthesis